MNDYEKLCDTNVLGLKGSHYKHGEDVYEKFKKQLKGAKKVGIETGLVWKEGIYL